jgi:hypothetical protein
MGYSFETPSSRLYPGRSKNRRASVGLDASISVSAAHSLLFKLTPAGIRRRRGQEAEEGGTDGGIRDGEEIAGRERE